MRIKQFRYAADNFGYLIYTGTSALAVDGGAVENMRAFLEAEGLELTYVANTHSHGDHTVGNGQLLSRTRARFLESGELLKTGHLDLAGETIRVYPTPGHTRDSITFHCGPVLITGDTLFNGTVGNCFSGDLEGFFHSIRMLMDHPPDTRIYAGHDYVQASMAFARTLEPANPAIEAYLRSYDSGHVCSTLTDELRANPYLRFNDPAMVEVLRQKGLPVDTEFRRWESLMSLE